MNASKHEYWLNVDNITYTSSRYFCIDACVIYVKHLLNTRGSKHSFNMWRHSSYVNTVCLFFILDSKEESEERILHHMTGLFIFVYLVLVLNLTWSEPLFQVLETWLNVHWLFTEIRMSDISQWPFIEHLILLKADEYHAHLKTIESIISFKVVLSEFCIRKKYHTRIIIKCNNEIKENIWK